MSTEDALDHLRRVWGDRRGFGHLAAGHDPVATDSGSVEFDRFAEQSIRWPAEEAQARAWLEDNAERDCYFTPELSGNPTRTKERRKPLPTSWARVDLDHDRPVPELMALVVTCGGVVIGTGRPGHRHVYVRLAEEVAPEVAEELNRRLVARFGGDPAPTWHGAYMRLPSGVNTKRVTLGEVQP